MWKLNSTGAKEEISYKPKKYCELNKNANKSYQILWNIVKSVFRMKFMAFKCTHWKGTDIKNELVYTKKILKDEQTKPDTERIKSRAEINEI